MNKHFFKLFIIIVIACMFMPSCASIVSKSSYPVSIDSNPQGAEIVIKNRKGEDVYNGTTPATIKLKSSSSYMRGEKYTIIIKAPGHMEQTAYVGSKLNGWYGANIFLGGIIGFFIVDPATGAMFQLDSTPINLTLPKAE